MNPDGFNFVVSSEQIIYAITFCGVVWGAIYGFYRFVQRIKKPHDDLVDVIEEHTLWLKKDNDRLNVVEKSNKDILLDLQNDIYRRLERHDELLEKQSKAQLEMDKANKMILKSLIVMMNHQITGNGQEKLKKAMEELNEFLVDK